MYALTRMALPILAVTTRTQPVGSHNLLVDLVITTIPQVITRTTVTETGRIIMRSETRGSADPLAFHRLVVLPAISTPNLLPVPNPGTTCSNPTGNRSASARYYRRSRAWSRMPTKRHNG